MDYTYDTEALGKALEAARAQQQGPNSLGWTGEELHSLQPRILSCYAAPCKTSQPLVHFWRVAMLHFPQAFADHVERAIDPELNGPDDRPDMAPYLAMLGTLCPPPPPPPPPGPLSLPPCSTHAPLTPFLSACACAQQAIAAWQLCGSHVVAMWYLCDSYVLAAWSPHTPST